MLLKQENIIAHWLSPTRNNVKVFIEKIKEYLLLGKKYKLNPEFYSEASVLINYNTVIEF